MAHPPSTHIPHSRSEAIDYLFSRLNFEQRMPASNSAFRLERMERLLSELGDPHRQLQCVHVAGTKGKGSTCGMLQAMLLAAGQRTGLYTSPHLERIEERFNVGGSPCSEAELVALTATVAKAAQPLDRRGDAPTFFELTTAMALVHFVQTQVDWAVIEVGLGGRLDSTNVCLPQLAIITSISFDHMRQLGNTLEKIAAEKAGILKPGIPVICGIHQPGPREVVHRVAAERGCPLKQTGRDFQFRYLPPTPRACDSPQRCGPGLGQFDYSEPQGKSLRELQMGLAGEHQAANGAVAVAALGDLARRGLLTIDEAAIRLGLRNVRLPGRIELFDQFEPLVVLDTAHNDASLQALLQTLSGTFRARRKLAVIAASEDKPPRRLLPPLLEWADALIFTRFLNNPRSTPPEKLERAARQYLAELPQLADRANRPPALLTAAAPHEAFARALAESSRDDLICLTGSFFLAAELRPLLLPAAASERQ